MLAVRSVFNALSGGSEVRKEGRTEKAKEALESPVLLWIFESAIMVAAVPDHNNITTAILPCDPQVHIS